MRKVLVLSISVMTVITIPGLYVGYLLFGSLPASGGEVILETPGVAAPVRVDIDKYGIPSIYAETREDAFLGLGFIMARDRLFQMDLLRRKMLGRLSEIMGPALVKSDSWFRTMDFKNLAPAIFETLPEPQKRAVLAFTEGANRAIREHKVLPFEFLALGYKPEPWRVQDSISAVLAMYAKLSWRGDIERTTTVMRKALPDKLVGFLLPNSDDYVQYLYGKKDADLISAPLPAEEIDTLLQHNRQAFLQSPHLVSDIVPKRGSNAWVVAPSKTARHRAILANDMHLDLGVPNIWYRAELHYGDVDLYGFTLPGIPLLISGSNGHIAWGFTSSGADASDLILLDVDSADPSRYHTVDGNRKFTERTETIRVRDSSDVRLVVRATQWGPVMPEPLLGKPVAVRWTVLEPRANNLDYMNLDRVLTVDAALDLLNHAGGPLLQAFAVDDRGKIGWTMTGKIPLRAAKDEAINYPDGVSLTGDIVEWPGFIRPQDLPRRISPPSGYIVSANQRMVDDDYPYSVGTYNWRGYRAYRITQRLTEMHAITERDMFSLQLDAQTDFYRYYWNLALDVLKKPPGDASTPDLSTEIRQNLEAWNGRADRDSMGLGLLIEFRKALMEAILSPLFVDCYKLDPTFQYHWNYPDVPLQSLLNAKPKALLSYSTGHPNWDAFIKSILFRAAEQLKQRFGVARLDELPWARVNEAHIVHPLSTALPWLGFALDMTKDAPAGCEECINSFGWDGGPSDRFVVSPGHEDDGILQIPTGQSGHPLSANYRDQHRAWVEGKPLPLKAGKPVTSLRLVPPMGSPP